MGNSNSLKKVNFEDIQIAIKNIDNYLLINVLSDLEQSCLIKNTIPSLNEETVINNYLQKNKTIKIIIYGKNSNDDLIHKKYQQLRNLGFYNVYIYVGGLFQWLVLQDIYGEENFPTNSKCEDLLKYKETTAFNLRYMIEN